MREVLRQILISSMSLKNSIKGSVLADHFASLPFTNNRVIDDDFLDEEITGTTSLSS